jgi:general secretion pathway protein A
MYLPFFGLDQEPFSIAPDPHYLYMSERHREALAHLLYGVEGGGGFVVLTGAIGAGKTTLCRCLLEQIPEHCEVAYIFNPKLSAVELMQSVCDELSVPYERHAQPSIKTYLDPLNAYLLDAHTRQQHTLLIIDEAQNLSIDVLEQLRLLTNLETHDRKLLQIVLIGQPELRDILARPELEQLAQRVIARFHLQALSPTDTQNYIRHRLSVAGMEKAQPFTPRAMQRVHEITRGIPRRINVLCDRALLAAYVQNLRRIGPETVEEAAREVFGSARERRAQRRRQARSESAHSDSEATTSDSPWGVAWLVQQPRHTTLALALTALLLAVSAGLWWTRGSAPRDQPAPTAVATGRLSQPGGPSTASPTPASPTKQSSPPSTGPAAQTPATSPPRPALNRPGATPLASAEGLMAWASGPEEALWRRLAPAWSWETPQGPDLCLEAAQAGLACYRFGGSSLAWIRNANRPVILTLRPKTGPAQAVLLLGLGAQEALLTRADGAQAHAPLAVLGQVWRGDVATLWRAPAGYRQSLSEGQRGPAVDALAQDLAQWAQRPLPEPGVRFDALLREQVIAFQASHGLKPDGIAGAPTFMQLNRALGRKEPVLQSLP